MLVLLLNGCKTGNFHEETVGHGSQKNVVNNSEAAKPEKKDTNADKTGTVGNSTVSPKPDAPVASDTIAVEVNFTIDSGSGKHLISPYVYGLNELKFDSTGPRGIRFVRQGGNRLSAYNWENNASNSGSDWYNQNDGMLGNTNTPGNYPVDFVKTAFSHSAAALITVPMIGYVAADKGPKGDVNNTPDYLSKRFHISKAKKGASFSMTPNQNDRFVYQDEFVHFMEKMFPDARSTPATELFYSLDNEPALWATTHPRLRGEEKGRSGKQVTYAELMKKTIEYASAIKKVAPDAKIFGPALYGYTAFVNLQNAPDANGRDFIEFYLQQLAKAEKEKGLRLVDVLDVHWYPEVSVPGVGRIHSSKKADPQLEKERIQAPRSLWDKNYMEKSWITQNYLHNPIALLPDLQDKIDTYYPGTRIAITEYQYGGGNDMSGAIAQADVLGIFGRENLFAATLWKMGKAPQDFLWGAFEMFTSYNPKGDKFGDLSVDAKSSDVEKSSIYAALDTTTGGKRMTVILINKAETAVRAGVSIVHDEKFSSADVYQLTSADSNPRKAASIDVSNGNAFEYGMPARSISLIELNI
ncbi:MAG: glycoside hydrolase family 44 protein [Deltaproteobacteria bacterium]|nr:glycoside hydrolase family 44 protein [Deltaproteobacteria bacterium]